MFYWIKMTKLAGLALVCSLPLAAQVRFAAQPDRISVEIDGKPFTELFMGADTNKPYFHPLRSASGKIVTRMFPMAKVEGERRDHPHHRGLWFAHGDVNGFDYWTNENSEKRAITGRIVLKKVVALKSGKKSGMMAVDFEWLDPKGTPILNEARRVTFYSDPATRTVDFDITLTPTAGAVTFGDTKEGTFAIRVAAALEEDPKAAPASPKRTGRIVNSTGASGEAEVWGKRAPWMDYSGEIDGEKLGIAIFDHPGNPHYPTYCMARGYGLFAANPFGSREFEHDKTKNGAVTVEPGKSLRFRYRVVIHPGDAASAGLAAQYEKWAKGAER